MEEGEDAVAAVSDYVLGLRQSAAGGASVSSAIPPHAHSPTLLAPLLYIDIYMYIDIYL